MSVVAIVGRPNVGKSTLFNRLVGRRVAIVEDVPGVTRDRNYASAQIGERKITLVDTGGLELDSTDVLRAPMAAQVEAAVDEADVILFVVDVMDGVMGHDEEIASYLRKRQKSLILVVNKVDGPSREPLAAEFYSLGLDCMVDISAEHKLGISELVDKIAERLPPKVAPSPEEADAVRIAVLGRPNVGKSSFVNSIIGSDRVVVSPVAGTTVDTIDTFVEIDSKHYVLIDTAGIRRKSKVDDGVERWSVMRAIRAIDRAHVCLLLVDGSEGVTDQDLRILDLILRGGRAALICLNKWDLVDKDHKTFDETRKDIALKLGPHRHVPVLSMSALTGQRVQKTFEHAEQLFEEWKKRIPTSRLNEYIKDAMRGLAPPIIGRKRARIYYGTQVDTAPPAFHLYASYPEGFPEHYQRYLMNRLRDTFGFDGVPVRIYIKKRTRPGEEEV